MTTYTYTGFRITLSGTSATAAAMSTFSLTASDSLMLKYELDAGATGSMPGIHLVPSALGEIYKTMVGATRVALDSAAYVTEYHWGAGKVAQALVFKVPGETNVMHIFQLSGDWLPMMDTAAKYNAFIAGATATGTVTGPNAPSTSAPLPIVNHVFSPIAIKSPKVISYNDTLIANATFDTWGPLKTIKTGGGNDRVEALETNDKIDLGIGNDTALGHGGNDNILGAAGADSILGEAGADTLNGGLDADSLDGGSENDRIEGGLGADQVLGGAGNDLLYGDNALDQLNGGNDTLDGGSDNDRLYGGFGADSMLGGLGNDYLSGGNGNDSILGGTGSDSLYGGNGNDTISGNDGADVLFGGTGTDVLTGGLNIDHFNFAKTNGADRITDFENDVDQLVMNHNLGLGISTVADALAAATQVGSNVVFDFGLGDVLTVMNITKAALSNDIVFAV